MYERIEQDGAFVAVKTHYDEHRRLLTPPQARDWAKEHNNQNIARRLKREAEKAKPFYKMDRSEQFSDE
jgi:hypothetical protein